MKRRRTPTAAAQARATDAFRCAQEQVQCAAQVRVVVVIDQAQPQVAMQSQSFRLPETDKEHQGFIEYGYSRFEDYKINLYALVLGDAEYLNAQTILWSDVIYPLPDNPPPISAAE